MNHIENTRKEIKRYFNQELIIPDSKKSTLSPSKNFRLDTVEYKQDKAELNWEVIKVQIYDLRVNQIIFVFFVNSSEFFYGWIDKENIEYFICAEDIFGGQTIIDLTNRKMSSYSPEKEGFIWCDFHLSPDGKTLATIGCYWACPFEIKIFDFSDPMNLPLKEIKEIELLDNDEIIVGWIDNETLKMKGIKREKEPEYFENGSFRMKTMSETEIEREINIGI